MGSPVATPLRETRRSPQFSSGTIGFWPYTTLYITMEYTYLCHSQEIRKMETSP